MRCAARHTPFIALVVAAALGSACTAPGLDDEHEDAIDIQRIESSVRVRRSRAGEELLLIDVHATDTVMFTASAAGWSLSIDAVATPPGSAITATLRAEREPAAGAAGGATVQPLQIKNDLVIAGDEVYRLYEWQERNQLVESLYSGPLGPALRATAPYARAINAHLIEARPALDVVALFQSWPDGVEPAWPPLDDPRDVDPPGRLAGDIIGLGMTCSTSIRCPSFAPYCVTVDHDDEFGFCTQACFSDDDCQTSAGRGRCSMPVSDIPSVTGSVLACRVECDAGVCPGLLACREQTGSCEAPNSATP